MQNPEDSGFGSEGGEKFDEKNIRRRVYDALNVLMAMNIIAKEKKARSITSSPRDLFYGGALCTSKDGLGP